MLIVYKLLERARAETLNFLPDKVFIVRDLFKRYEG